MRKTYTLADVPGALRELINEYGGEVEQVVRGVVMDIAKGTAKELRATSPRKSGDYAKAWAYKPNKVHGYIVSYAVYNKKPFYRLTHLLENGTPNADARPHIAVAEQHAKEKIIEQMQKELEAIK